MKIIVILIMILIIVWLIVKRVDIDNEEKVRQVSGELRIKYPNFVKAIRILYQQKANLYADNGKALCYKIPVKTFNKHMGDMLYSLIDTSNIGNNFYLIQVYTGLDGIEVVTERYYMKSDADLEVDEYIQIWKDFDIEIAIQPRFLKSVGRDHFYKPL
jgi:hypothetical protein